MGTSLIYQENEELVNYTSAGRLSVAECPDPTAKAHGFDDDFYNAVKISHMSRNGDRNHSFPGLALPSTPGIITQPTPARSLFTLKKEGMMNT